MSRGLQAVLGSDDPGIFGASELSDDFALAYLAWGLDLRSLKKLALNSITASGLSADRKKRQLWLFEVRWRKWIGSVLIDFLTRIEFSNLPTDPAPCGLFGSKQSLSTAVASAAIAAHKNQPQFAWRGIEGGGTCTNLLFSGAATTSPRAPEWKAGYSGTELKWTTAGFRAAYTEP